ncbi:T-cell surface glycoprotein CD3 zeta chain isoform X4 [Columba livia]|uniref:T-cell surface glycoprotein CD3 zeta chain isoform X4 n=1 Tax=Columba livia TaxID=8932 RepID=UPI0031BBBB7F
MKWRRIAIFALLQARLPVTDAVPVLGLTDPRLCYLLDGFLFIYAVVMTALFVKVKLSQASEPQLQPGQNDVYNQRRRNPQDTVYTSLQKDKMGEAYSEIGMKGEQRRRGKGNEGLYQGLSTATKDTYDALQMQPLPPR